MVYGLEREDTHKLEAVVSNLTVSQRVWVKMLWCRCPDKAVQLRIALGKRFRSVQMLSGWL